MSKEEISPQEERTQLGKEKPKSKDTARLIWASKPKKEPVAKDLDFQTAEEVYPNKEDIKSKDKKLNVFWTETKNVSDDPNRIIWGDNLLVMKALLAKGYEGQIDLIYIDPPFNTGENFNFSNQVQIGDATFDKELTMNERLAYTDTWKRGHDSFLDMLYPRLQLMRKLLSDKGSIFVHIGTNVSHFVRILMDEVFGLENFRNEIYVKRMKKNNQSQFETIKSMNTSFDTILLYSKNPDVKYVAPLKKMSIKENNWHSFDASQNRPNLVYPIEGELPGAGCWRWTKERAFVALKNYKEDSLCSDKNRDYLRVRVNKNKKIIEYYVHPREYEICDSDWLDIPAYASSTGYSTEKNETLLKRIIEMSTKENQIVADFFCGSGTTAAVAEKLGRKWITTDLSKTSIQVTRSRLVNHGAKPFLIQNLGNYQRQLIYASEVNLTEMYNIILKLYGAIPRKDKQGFGISKEDKNTLVYVCEPDRPMMAKKAYDLAREAKVMDGKGYKRIVILAWDYEIGYDNDLNKIIPKKKDLPDIESKLIPPDVYRYLRSTKHGDVDVSNKIVFFQKPYLKLSDPEIISETKDEARVRIKLDRYVVPGNDFPIRDNDEEKVREKRKQIEELLRKNFAYILDYWTIDWDYDGDVFRSNWQAIKEKKSSEPVSIVAETSLKKGKKHSIAVRVVDIFGNDAFGIKEINLK